MGKWNILGPPSRKRKHLWTEMHSISTFIDTKSKNSNCNLMPHITCFHGLCVISVVESKFTSIRKACTNFFSIQNAHYYNAHFKYVSMVNFQKGNLKLTF